MALPLFYFLGELMRNAEQPGIAGIAGSPYVPGPPCRRTVNVAKAAGLYEIAAASDPAAACNLAYMYANGEGVAQDFAKAIVLYRRAHEAGTRGASYALHRAHDGEVAAD